MKKKIMYLDVARIAATFAVIAIHTATQGPFWNDFGKYTGFTTPESHILIFFASISRWAVPVFCMISGALFLDPDRKVDTKKLYTKNILRMVISFVVWSALYLLLQPDIREQLTLAGEIKRFVRGNYHMWFIYLIVGFYIAVPLIRKFTEDKKTALYFVGVSVVFTFIIPNLLLHPKLDWASAATYKMFMYLPIGYTFYFIIGYLINKFGIKKWLKAIIYVLGPISFLATAYIAVAQSQKTGVFFDQIGDYDSITVLFESLFVITLIKDITEKIKFKSRGEKFIGTLSKDTFGLYLLHAIVMRFFDTFCGINSMTFNPLISVPIVIIITFITGTIISHILNKIPIVNKYLV